MLERRVHRRVRDVPIRGLAEVVRAALAELRRRGAAALNLLSLLAESGPAGPEVPRGFALEDPDPPPERLVAALVLAPSAPPAVLGASTVAGRGPGRAAA